MAPICRGTLFIHRSIAIAVGCFAMAQAPFVSAQSSAPAAADSPQSVEALIKELGLVESQTLARTRRGLARAEEGSAARCGSRHTRSERCFRSDSS